MINNLKVYLEASNKVPTNEKQKDALVTRLPRRTVATQCPRSQPGQVTQQLQQSTCLPCVGQSIQTSHISLTEKSVQTEVIDEKSEVNSCDAAAIEVVQAEVKQLKRKVAELVFENNRHHHALSNCTFCASDNDSTIASTFNESIRA